MQIDVAEYDPRAADLLAFSAPWREPSGWLIKAATRSSVSHVAGVGLVGVEDLEQEVRRRQWPRRPDIVGCSLNRLLAHVGFSRRPLLFESTTQAPERCALIGERICGVQAHEPRERIDSYLRKGGRVWLYRPTRDFRLDTNQSFRLTEFLLRHLGERYDWRQAAFSGTIIARRVCRWATDANLHSLFCSEYWAAALEQIRLLPLKNPSLFTPAGLVAAVVELGSLALVGQFTRGRFSGDPRR